MPRTHVTSQDAARACCNEFSASRRSVLRGALGLGSAMALTQMFGDSLMQSTFAGVKGGNTLVVLSGATSTEPSPWPP